MKKLITSITIGKHVLPVVQAQLEVLLNGVSITGNIILSKTKMFQKVSFGIGHPITFSLGVEKKLFTFTILSRKNIKNGSLISLGIVDEFTAPLYLNYKSFYLGKDTPSKLIKNLLIENGVPEKKIVIKGETNTNKREYVVPYISHYTALSKLNQYDESMFFINDITTEEASIKLLSIGEITKKVTPVLSINPLLENFTLTHKNNYDILNYRNNGVLGYKSGKFDASKGEFVEVKHASTFTLSSDNPPFFFQEVARTLMLSQSTIELLIPGDFKYTVGAQVKITNSVMQGTYIIVKTIHTFEGDLSWNMKLLLALIY